ncbi:methyl-accepting chemotaxis protein, partial [Pseudomonas aeruginosa]|uniref:methyl-accepting chemotaxis protein n=1 Tax=Pseudomonas aeruginosa TaxID=287 RepID=UPI0031B7BF08
QEAESSPAIPSPGRIYKQLQARLVVGKVDVGSTLVESAGETMAEIVSAVTRVTDIMGEIASASDEQSRGIDQVGLAVAEMDRVTQQNAALVEESAAAAAALYR